MGKSWLSDWGSHLSIWLHKVAMLLSTLFLISSRKPGGKVVRTLSMAILLSCVERFRANSTIIPSRNGTSVSSITASCVPASTLPSAPTKSLPGACALALATARETSSSPTTSSAICRSSSVGMTKTFIRLALVLIIPSFLPIVAWLRAASSSISRPLR